MTTPTTPPPADEELVSQLRALGVIYAGLVRFRGEDAHFDAAAGIRPTGDPLRAAELKQMVDRIVQAVHDGHAVLTAPDADGFMQMRITDAGVAVLDQAAAEQAAQRRDRGSP